jgi:hypothetical protein
MDEIRPDWAMVGWRGPDRKCWLIASTELDTAQLDWLRAEYQFRSWDDFTALNAFRPKWHLDVIGTGRFTITRADSYAQCLADLLFNHHWRPDASRSGLPTDDDVTRGLLAARRTEIGGNHG